MRKTHGVLMAAICVLFLAGCGSASYVKSELTGQAKPEGGIAETIPPTKQYRVNHDKLWKAAKQVLEHQGYIFEANPSSGTIKTEPRAVGDTKSFKVVGAHYYAKLHITVEGASITYRARFDKKSNLTTGEQNVEYPEKENALRKEFYDALDKALGI